MRTSVCLLPLLTVAACSHAAPLRVVVLRDDLPGLDLGLVTGLTQVMEEAGHAVRPLAAVQLADPGVLNRGQVDVLVLTHSPVFPGRARASVWPSCRPAGTWSCWVASPSRGRSSASAKPGRTWPGSRPPCGGSPRRGCWSMSPASSQAPGSGARIVPSTPRRSRRAPAQAAPACGLT